MSQSTPTAEEIRRTLTVRASPTAQAAPNPPPAAASSYRGGRLYTVTGPGQEILGRFGSAAAARQFAAARAADAYVTATQLEEEWEGVDDLFSAL